MYLPVGSLTAGTDFNATKYPGVAKPSTPATLTIFKGLQNQLNRVADVKGLSKIGADGDIGPGTVALFQAVQNAASFDVNDLSAQAGAQSPASAMAGPVVPLSNTNAAVIASNADFSSVVIQSYADALGAPAQVSGKIVITPTTLVSSNGTETQVAGSAENALSSLGQLGTVEKLAVVGLLGAIGYMVLGKKGRKARR